MRTLRLLLMLACAVGCYGQIDVFYTGRMLGYFRYPDQQDPDMNACGWHNQPMNRPAQDLYDIWTGLRSKSAHPLLVGMGDNFGPDLYARTFSRPPAHSAVPVPYPGKDLYVWSHGAWVPDNTVVAPLGPHDAIPADNVGCFILQMGYAALVPGKHDFYFGPDRLRLMAKFLYADPDRGTALLAANLSIATAAPDAKPRLPLYQIEHELKSKMHIPANGTQPYTVLPLVSGDDPSPGVNFPDVVLPYYRRFEVDNAYYLTAGSNTSRVVPGDFVEPKKLMSGALPASSDDILTDKPLHLDGAAPQDVTAVLRIQGLMICPNPGGPGPTRDPYAFTAPGRACTPVPAATKGQDGSEYKSGRIVFESLEEILTPGRDYAACLQVAPNGPANARRKTAEYYCQPFYVAEPFFRYTRVKAETASANAPKEDDPFIVKDAGGLKVAIFGLLDPNLQGQIGRLNYGWWNQNTAYETTAQISGLADALKQAMMRCQLVTGCDKADRKILLAQMPAAEATELLGNIAAPLFSLVVAETDSTNKTLAGTVSRDLPDDTSSPRFVVAPDELYASGKLTYQIRRATVTQARTSAADPKPQTWTLTSAVDPKPRSYAIPSLAAGVCDLTDKATGNNTLRCLAIRTLRYDGLPAAANVVNGTWNSGQILQRLALLAMQRQHAHTADISFLQTRDMFRPEVYGAAGIDPNNLQEVLDRLFWKGDYAVRVPVTGATLTAIMQASSDFSTLESNPVNVDPEKGRSLLTLGLFKEASEQNWTVNGALLDPAKAYEVTMTDFLALGDTGYSQLKTPLVPYPYRIKDFRSLDPVSGVICREIKRAAMPSARCYDDPLVAAEHLDYTQALPPDTTPGLTSSRQTISYLNPRYTRDRFREFYAGQNAAENLSAQKAFWSFELEKGDVGLNIDVHKRFKTINPASPPVQTASLNNEFAGITVAPVTAPNAYTVTFDDRWRLKYSRQTIDWFLLHESTYAYTRTQDSADNGYARSLSQNMMAMESGLLYHVWPVRRTPRRFDVLLSGRAESQVLSPREDLALQSGTLPGTLRRPVDLFGKIGPRYTDERSWVEAGYLKGRSLVNPYQIVFNDGRNDSPFLIPGCNLCSTPYPGGLANPPAQNAPFLDWVAYLSSPYPIPNSTGTTGTPAMTTPFIDPNTKFYGKYTGRPLSGFFLNFSYNVPLPVGKYYPDWAGGKPIALLVENNGRWYFNNTGDLATQTKYLDKLALSIILPVVGNFSFKPEVDFVYYRNKVAAIPFRSVNYIGTLSYTFAWREGQPWRRMWRFASPAPTASVPAGGR